MVRTFIAGLSRRPALTLGRWMQLSQEYDVRNTPLEGPST
jgi:hypothetical protein